MEVDDAERGILGAKATSAICVQSFDDSLNSAIHITYRISLRSSSLREPRYPLLKVVSHYVVNVIRRTRATGAAHRRWHFRFQMGWFNDRFRRVSRCVRAAAAAVCGCCVAP